MGIAEKALVNKTGARGLRGIIESLMTDIMFEIPSEDKVKEVIITRQVVDGEAEPTIVRGDSSSADTNTNVS